MAFQKCYVQQTSSICCNRSGSTGNYLDIRGNAAIARVAIFLTFHKKRILSCQGRFFLHYERPGLIVNFLRGLIYGLTKARKRRFCRNRMSTLAASLEKRKSSLLGNNKCRKWPFALFPLGILQPRRVWQRGCYMASNLGKLQFGTERTRISRPRVPKSFSYVPPQPLRAVKILSRCCRQSAGGKIFFKLLPDLTAT